MELQASKILKPSEMTFPFFPALEPYESYLLADFANFQSLLPTPQQMHLGEAMRYSLLTGGKRLRPVLCLAWAEALELEAKNVWAWATAIEWLHTYSLIHDDLPAMDNDDLRRGQPTNHKVYGEDIALLAGDSLLSESFGKIIAAYGSQTGLALSLVQLLIDAAGARGMVGGQAIDLRLPPTVSQETIFHLHQLKTGALFRACVEGVFHIAKSKSCLVPHEQKFFSEFGTDFGLAFQMNDDILDFATDKGSPKNLCQLKGITEVTSLLRELTQSLLLRLDSLPKAQILKTLIEFNFHRQH